MNLTNLLFKLFQNSQSTLKHFQLVASKMISVPINSLPNLEVMGLAFHQEHDNQIEAFDYFMKSFIDSDIVCKNLKEFILINLHNAPKVLNYFITNYPNHFMDAPCISALEHIPLKISFLNLENLAAYKFIPQVEYLILDVQNFSTP